MASMLRMFVISPCSEISTFNRHALEHHACHGPLIIRKPEQIFIFLMIINIISVLSNKMCIKMITGRWAFESEIAMLFDIVIAFANENFEVKKLGKQMNNKKWKWWSHWKKRKTVKLWTLTRWTIMQLLIIPVFREFLMTMGNVYGTVWTEVSRKWDCKCVNGAMPVISSVNHRNTQTKALGKDWKEARWGLNGSFLWVECFPLPICLTF